MIRDYKTQTTMYKNKQQEYIVQHGEIQPLFCNNLKWNIIYKKRPREMLGGGRWEGGSCLGMHVRIKDFKI